MTIFLQCASLSLSLCLSYSLSRYLCVSQANNAGDFFPIWGTCMGMQLLSVIVAEKNVLTYTTAENIALPLNLTAGL